MDKEQLKGMVRHLLGERQALQHLEEALTIALNAENSVVEATKAVKEAGDELARLRVDQAKVLEQAKAEQAKYEAERVKRLKEIADEKVRFNKECEETHVKIENEGNRRMAQLQGRYDELKKQITELEAHAVEGQKKLGDLDSAIKVKEQEYLSAEAAVERAKKALSDLKARL